MARPFSAILRAIHLDAGLPFANVLSEADIQKAFDDVDCHFAENEDASVGRSSRRGKGIPNATPSCRHDLARRQMRHERIACRTAEGGLVRRDRETTRSRWSLVHVSGTT